MNQAFRSGLTLGLFIVVASLFILPFEPPGSAEQIVTLLALGSGLAMVAVIAFVIRKFSR